MKNSKLMVMILSMLIAVASCDQVAEQETEIEATVINGPASGPEPELAYPDQQGELVSLSGACDICEYELINGEIVVEGDIILTPEQLELQQTPEGRQLGAGRSNIASRWPNNIVYYRINPGLPNQARVTNAIAHWEANSNLTFVVRTSQSNYIEFRPASGCSSSLGMIGGKQYINLASGCSTGNTIHEIGHAIGLFHEQTRTDRDSHVNILWSNIQSGREGNFKKYTQIGYSGFNYGAFDFGSIMMYGSYFFSQNGQPTITRKNGTTFNVQRTALSNTDIGIGEWMYPEVGHVSSGSTSDLDRYRSLYRTVVAAGADLNDIAAVAIAGSNDHCYVWYKDGTVSSGKSNDLDRYRNRYYYSLAPGRTPNDIAGIGIAGSNDRCYVWYKDGTVSSGTSSDLDRYRSPYNYSLAPGRNPSDIIGVAIAGSNDHCYVWYDNGTVSSGTSSDLDRYRSPYFFSLAPGKTRSDVLGIGIAGSNDRSYVWYKR